MKTKNGNLYRILKGLFAITLLTSILIASCSSDDPNPDSNPTQTVGIKGSVNDENGNPYPKTGVSFSKGFDKIGKFTDAAGNFEIKTKDIGNYDATIVLPLSTELVTNIPISVNVQANQVAKVYFVVKPVPAEAHLNFGSVQLLEEIEAKNGNTPTDPNEPLFAKNIFDEPLGQLNIIKAPDGHQVTLSEFQTANGNLMVHCNGDSSTIEINFEGMIPNGTYTFWLAYMKRKVTVGQNIDFENDFVNFTNPPIGASDGTENIAIADARGAISVTLEHGSCVLTDEVALVIPILYHINGQTFGGGHVPDAEEMAQMLVYFQ